MHVREQLTTVVSAVSPKILFALAIMSVAGCGDSGTVRVAGRILIEGEPAVGGRLMLVPKSGDGRRAFSGVTENGEYELRTQEGVVGAFPGEYEATLIQEASDAMRNKIHQASRGRANAADVKVRYISPRGKTIRITTDDVEDLEIAIEQSTGWQAKFIE